MPMGPEKFLMGVHGRHGRRLDTYAEFKLDNTDKTETMLGAKLKFDGGEIRGNVTTAGKVESIYRKFINIFELELQTKMDLTQNAKTEFGVALSMR